MTSTAAQPNGGRRDLDKPLYTIGIAADILATTTQTLMMYEHFGLVVPTRSGSSNRRLFSQRDLLAIGVCFPNHHSPLRLRIATFYPTSRLRSNDRICSIGSSVMCPVSLPAAGVVQVSVATAQRIPLARAMR